MKECEKKAVRIPQKNPWGIVPDPMKSQKKCSWNFWKISWKTSEKKLNKSEGFYKRIGGGISE